MIAVPAKPNVMPSNCRQEKDFPKAMTESINAKIGVKALSNPAMALGICVCAVAYRKAGNALPNNPTTSNGQNLVQSILLS